MTIGISMSPEEAGLVSATGKISGVVCSEDRAIELEALIAEIQAIAIEVKAMEADNQERAHRGESPAWNWAEFTTRANATRKLAGKIRQLTLRTQ